MKGRGKRATGGVNEAAEDLKSKPQRYNNASKVFDEAEQKKSGGKAMGKDAKKRMDRKPRKSGGSCDSNPLSSAARGKAPKGHSVEMGMD